jgi:flagellar hook-length control protein FliK
MTEMVSMMNLMNTKPASAPKNNSVEKNDKNDDFVSSLEKKIKKASNKASDKSTEDKITLNEKDIKKLEEIIEKNPEDLSQEDIAGVITALTNIINQLSELKLSTDGTKGEKLALNQSLKGIIKGLETVKSKFIKIDLKEFNLKNLDLKRSDLKRSDLKNLDLKEGSELFPKKEIKELLANLKGKFVNNGDGEKERMIHHRAINQSNIARLSRDNQNKVERNIDIKGKDIVVEENKVVTKSEQIFTEKSKDIIVSSEQQGSKEVDFSSTKNFVVNNSQTLDNTSPNKIIVSNKEVTFKNIADQITNQVDLVSNNKGKDITIELRPEALGRLHLKVTVKDGIVSAKILAENGQVKELLEGNLGKLRNNLGQKNLQIENFDVSTGHNGEELAQSFNENRQFEFSQNQGKGDSKKVTLDDTEEFALIEEDLTTEETQEEKEYPMDNLDYIA